MKKFTLILAAFALIFTGCEKDGIEPQNTALPTSPEPKPEKVAIPFTGNWSRQFEAGPGNLHAAVYYVYNDSIRYTLTGPVGQADYVIHRDTFLLDSNQFIGHTPDSTFYLIYVKNVSNDSITLYKQTVTDVTEGLGIAIPPDGTGQNYGWNTYHKQ